MRFTICQKRKCKGEGGLGTSPEWCLNTVLGHVNYILKKMATTKWFGPLSLLIFKHNNDVTEYMPQEAS